VPQDSGHNFFYEHTEATATCSIHINRLLVTTFTEATATCSIHVYIFCFDGGFGFTLTFYESSSAATLDGRSPLHLFQQNRSIRLVYSQLVGWARMKSYLDYILSHCTQGSFIFCHKNGRPVVMPAFAPNEFDPLPRFLPISWSALIRRATSTTSRVDALRVVLFLCLKHGIPAMMLAFFPNSLDPLDRVVANWLDELLLGAMATFRVAAPRVVSIT
jgi:hypothetical protein